MSSPLPIRYGAPGLGCEVRGPLRHPVTSPSPRPGCGSPNAKVIINIINTNTTHQNMRRCRAGLGVGGVVDAGRHAVADEVHEEGLLQTTGVAAEL